MYQLDPPRFSKLTTLELTLKRPGQHPANQISVYVIVPPLLSPQTLILNYVLKRKKAEYALS